MKYLWRLLAILTVFCLAISVSNPAIVSAKDKPKSEKSSKQADDYLTWNRSYTNFDYLSTPQLHGHISLGYDGKAILIRTAKEWQNGRDRGYLKADYKISKYKGKEKVTSYVYPFPEDMHTAAEYPRQEIVPEVQIDITIPQSEIDRVETDLTETSLRFYGYKAKDGHLILTNGKADDLTVYVYRPEESQTYTVNVEKTAIRKAPDFRAKSLGDISQGEEVTTSSTFIGPGKTNHLDVGWIETEIKGQKGYVWTGDLTRQTKPSSSTTSQASAKTSQSSSSVENQSGAVNLDQIRQGNMTSLAGTWRSNKGTEWVIDSYGILSTGELLEPSESQTSPEGVNLDMKYRSVVTPLILLPKGVKHGDSDTSKDRLYMDFGGSSDVAYYYRE